MTLGRVVAPRSMPDEAPGLVLKGRSGEEAGAEPSTAISTARAAAPR